MILLDAFTVITHVVTQLISKWLLPPLSVQSDLYSKTPLYRALTGGKNLESLEEDDWHSLLECDLSLDRPCLPWLEQIIRVQRYSTRNFASSITQHLHGSYKGGGSIILFHDPIFPRALKTIAKPPLMLTCVGRIEQLALPIVAVVGSRKASYLSLNACIELGSKLAAENVCVVSGGAIGCDIAVHQGMLSTNQKNVNACVVFAGGLHELYPRTNNSIFELLRRRGGLFLSERLWHQWSVPKDFPIRNRIVSGVSEAVIVMQAAQGSGAMITANEALEQGREVYVLAHDPFDVRADGSLQLIEDGAQDFANIQEVMDMLICADEPADMIGEISSTCQSSTNPGSVDGELLIN